MFRKLSFIFLLAVLFGAFLVIRPYLMKKEDPPKLEDRLPEAEFIAVADCIKFAKEISGMLYYYKVSYRDFLSPEFIVSQAKNYGLQLQKNVYVFANSDGEYGILSELSDSTLLQQGIEKLNYFFSVKELKINKQKVLKIHNQNSYLFYGDDYICFYKGNNLTEQLKRITSAKAKQVSSAWMTLINEQKNLGKSILVYAQLKDFKDLNVNQVTAYPHVDSTHVYFYSHLNSNDTIPFQLKSGGKDFKLGEFTRTAINLHLDVTHLQKHPEHVLYAYLAKQSNRIRFPFKEFLANWNGDISFQQGGWINIEESYIESELDEDFNVTEVIKNRLTKVPGFTLAYSVVQPNRSLLNTMLKKGFMTEQEGKFHLLFSPPLQFSQTKDNMHVFYATKAIPKMEKASKSYVQWSNKGTKYLITIDSVSTFDIYGNMKFSLEQILTSQKLKDK